MLYCYGALWYNYSKHNQANDFNHIVDIFFSYWRGLVPGLGNRPAQNRPTARDSNVCKMPQEQALVYWFFKWPLKTRFIVIHRSHWIYYNGSISHDDVIKWKHFPRYWPFVWGIHRWPVDSPDKGQWRGALMLYLIWAWINGWVNNREAGDLRRHRAYHHVIVMKLPYFNEAEWRIYGSVNIYFFQLMACRLIAAMPLSEPVKTYCLQGTGWNSEMFHIHMMTSFNGNIFRVTGHLCGELTGHRIFLTIASVVPCVFAILYYHWSVL